MYDGDDPISMYRSAMMQRAGGGAPRRFDEYYRCYPVAMLPGAEKDTANYGGKVFLPTSALEKLTRLHITYPMLFELINGKKERSTHAGVLEFTAEEGKIYLPYWLMQTLLLETGDLIQIKSTDLPPGTFIKLQPQSPSFLDITDPKAVLENTFRNFSCMTKGDVFSFSYCDSVYDIAVLEVKPDNGTHAICTLETDLSVDFAEPLGYQEHMKAQAEANQKVSRAPIGGKIHTQGTMAQAINYSAIAPSSGTLATGAKSASSYFTGGGNRLGNRRGNKNSGTSTPKELNAANPPRLNGGNGPQPLRLPPGKLFFGYEYVAPKKKDQQPESEQQEKAHFQGQGKSLRGKVVDGTNSQKDDTQTPTYSNAKSAGRTLKDTKR